MRHLSMYLLLVSCLLTSCATSKQAAQQEDPLNGLAARVKTEKIDSPSVQPVSLPKSVAGWVKQAVSSIGGSGKFKNKGTIIYQVGEGHTAGAATKPGSMAIGTGATAVDAGKAAAPVQTGQNHQAADNTKAGQKGGAAATAPNASATTTNPGTPWWLFVLLFVLGFATRQFGPGLLRRVLV